MWLLWVALIEKSNRNLTEFKMIVELPARRVSFTGFRFVNDAICFVNVIKVMTDSPQYKLGFSGQIHFAQYIMPRSGLAL